MLLMIDDFIEHLKFVKRYSDHTLTNYTIDLNQFLAFYGEDPNWLEVNNKDVRAFVVELSKNKYAPKSIKRKLSSLSRFFKYLIKEEVIKTNPCKGVTTPKANKPLPKFYKANELDQILDVDIQNFSFEELRDYMIFKTIYYCGLRKQELIDLKLEDVNINQAEIKVFGKGGKERLIPLLPELVNDLQVYMNLRAEVLISERKLKHLFFTKQQKELYPKFVYNIVNNYLNKANVAGKKSPHGLRHSFATHLLARGADIESVKELLGHESLAATQVYLHHSIASLKEVYKKAHPKGD